MNTYPPRKHPQDIVRKQMSFGISIEDWRMLKRVASKDSVSMTQMLEAFIEPELKKLRDKGH